MRRGESNERLHAWEECCAYDVGKRGMIKMRKIRWFAVLIFLLLFSTCNAFAEEVRQSRVNQVSVTYQKNVALVGKYSFSGFGNDADRNRAKQDSICL